MLMLHSINKLKLGNFSRTSQLKYLNVTSVFQTNSFSNIFSNETIHKSLKSKPFKEIARGWLIYNLLRFDFLVKHSESLLNLSKRLIGVKATRYLLKNSLYAQFAGGEEKTEVLDRVKKLNQQKIRTFLSYSAEETDQNSEDKFENMKNHILDCLNIVLASSKANEGMTAIKISPLASLELQKKVSTIIQNKHDCFTRLNEQVPSDNNRNPARMKLQTFHSNVLKIDPLLSAGAIEDLFQEVSGAREYISARRWLDNLNGDVEIYKLLKAKSANWIELDSIEGREWNNLLLRIEEIGSACQENNITLLVDAEQTYIQRAIHYIAVHFLMKKFNRDKCLVYNTFQCKLRSTFNELNMDVDFAKEENIHYGLKMVRGAYLIEERKRAKEMGYPDPTNQDLEATTEMYNRVMDLALEEVKRDRMQLIVATHNKDSVLRATTEMEKLGIPKRGGVKFGQLLGE